MPAFFTALINAVLGSFAKALNDYLSERRRDKALVGEGYLKAQVEIGKATQDDLERYAQLQADRARDAAAVSERLRAMAERKAAGHK